MATIDDVAKLAGVSVATVSRVINHSDAVRRQTADKVNAAIKELSYIPNISARNLRRNESRIIMMLAPNFSNPYYTSILSGICDKTRELGYISLIYNTYDTLSLNAQTLETLIEQHHVDGTIILACNHNDTWIDSFKGKSNIVLCSEYVEDSSIPHIAIDNFTAAEQSVSHLIELGHKKIAFLGSDNAFNSTRRRLLGYHSALKHAKIDPNPAYIANGSIDYSFQSGKTAAQGLLTLPDPPTAIFCVSDVLALGAIAYASEHGIRVPQDLSVIGFDDVDYTTMFHPHITTVKIPCYELGQKAMELLHLQIQKEPTQTQTFLPHQFILRESCASPLSCVPGKEDCSC